MADWRRPGERVGRVFSLPNLEMLAVTHGARSDAGMMAAYRASNSSRVTGSLTPKKRDRSEASRITKFAMWDAARPMIRPEWRITRSGTPFRIPIRCKRVPPGQKTFPVFGWTRLVRSSPDDGWKNTTPSCRNRRRCSTSPT